MTSYHLRNYVGFREAICEDEIPHYLIKSKLKSIKSELICEVCKINRAIITLNSHLFCLDCEKEFFASDNKLEDFIKLPRFLENYIDRERKQMENGENND